MSGEIWLGDAAIALEALGTSYARQQMILRLLGLAPPRPLNVPPPVLPSRRDPAPFPLPLRDDTPEPLVPPSPSPLTARPPGELPILDPVAVEPPSPGAWPVEPLARVEPARLRAARPHEPLLAPLSTSALLGTALSRPVPEGEIDIDAVVSAISQARPLDALPRLPVRTLRFGVQVLADIGSGMQPFGRDQQDLISRVRRLIGLERVDVQRFAYSPLRGTGSGPRWTWRPFRPPPPGTAILVLSDFGIGGPPADYLRSERGEWEEFLDALDHQVIGFVPYPEPRWPSWLRARLPLVCWDRGTTVSTIRSRVP